MRLRWWEVIALLPPLVAAGLLYVAGAWVTAAVVTSIAAFAAASRAHLVERNIAGFHARMKGTILLLRATALLAIYLLLVYGWFVMRQDHWVRDRRGLVAFYATVAVALFLLRDIRRLGVEADNWTRGGAMEVTVADALDALRNEGWLVVHNMLREDGAGNVDHFVSAPNGVAFAIETKAGRARVADRSQAVGNAVWARSKFGVRFVTPVICAGVDPPPQPTPFRHGNATVWVVALPQLAPLLRKQFDQRAATRSQPWPPRR